MLTDLIKNLQNKPEHTKVKILYFSAALTVVLVLAVWISNLGAYKAAFINPIGDNEAASSLKASVLDSFLENQESGIRNQENIEEDTQGNKETEKIFESESFFEHEPQSRGQRNEETDSKFEIRNSKLDSEIKEIEGIEEIGGESIEPAKEESKIFKLPVE